MDELINTRHVIVCVQGCHLQNFHPNPLMAGRFFQVQFGHRTRADFEPSTGG